MNPIGVGIIGAGVGRSQAPGFLGDKRVSKVVLCDIDSAKLAERAKAVGIEETTTDWKEIVERDDIHLVSVASPDPLHPEMAIAALDAGKHVLCEKPMAPTLPEARQMIAAVERSGKKLLVNNVLRFFERFKYVKKMVDAGELGQIYAAEGDYLHNTVDLIRNGWRGPHRHSCMTGGGVHLIDLLRWIVAETEEAFCYSTYGVMTEAEAKSPDCMLAILKLENGAVAKAMTNMAVQRPALHNFILYGTKGVFINAKPDGLLYRGHNSKPEPVTALYGATERSKGQKAAAVAHFLDCIEKDEAPLVDVYEGARTIAACDAIFESCQTGRPVKVERI
ncbi:MAG: Gfo/Idh/MocA family oxidoreductase [Planctomycetes bacterium]|nr:Gfo/Idh/MocA family oxidoreductase [Planctomycetota bacterium]